MQHNIFTPEFRYLLYIILTCIRLNQHLGIYYDKNELGDQAYSGTMYAFLEKYFKKYSNISIFIEFVPGFLSNPYSNSNTYEYESKFSLILILNFNPLSHIQTGLIKELQVRRIEYILITPQYELNVAYLKPFFHMTSLDLNNWELLDFFFKIIDRFISINTKSSVEIKKEEKELKNTKNKYYYFKSLLYLNILISNDQLYKNHIKKYIKTNQDILNISNIKKYIIMFLRDSKYKYGFKKIFSIKLTYKKIYLKIKKNINTLYTFKDFLEQFIKQTFQIILKRYKKFVCLRNNILKSNAN